MTDPDFKLMDTLTRIQAQLHTVETRLLYAAIKGKISPEVRTACAEHLKDCAKQLHKLPEEE